MPGSAATGNVIVHSDAAGKLTLRDETGKVIGQRSADIYVSQFAPTAWGQGPARDKILAATQDFVYVLSMDGTTIAKLPAPDVVEKAAPSVQGVPVRFTGGSPYYALIVRHEQGDRWTQLHVYDSANKIIYDERLPGDCAALAAQKNQDKTEDLLLGCDTSVVKYSSAGGASVSGTVRELSKPDCHSPPELSRATDRAEDHRPMTSSRKPSLTPGVRNQECELKQFTLAIFWNQ